MAVRQDDVVQAAEGVFRVRGSLVNRYLPADGGELTLVDAGHPGDAGDAEVPHARREHQEQVAVLTLLAHAWRPPVAAWALRALRRGGTRDVRAPAVLPFPSVGTLDLPGSPVPVPTHGHTRATHRLPPATRRRRPVR